MTTENKELLSRMIVKEFNEIDFSMDYIYGKSSKLINLSLELGLTDLAQQLESDRLIY
ncbi:MAG: hypothetical protein KDC74_10090 [Flavobacteriaceae bacterium]|nr:hypothetical protein [Flavobacteriaceae bacterium]